MFDALLRPVINPALPGSAGPLHMLASPQTTLHSRECLSGAFVGGAAGGAIALGHHLPGLGLILVSRLLDGLDGAVARATRPTDFGGYLDITCDYIFYLAVPLGFAFSNMQDMPYALILTASFTLTAVSFLAFAAVAGKRGLTTAADGPKSFFYNTGLAEGFETIAAFMLMCLLTDQFPVIASVLAVLCVVTVLQRSFAAAKEFSDPAADKDGAAPP